MWECPNCHRAFDKQGQMHTCKSVPLDDHFKNKQLARDIFDHLVQEIDQRVGKVKIVSLPCCIHLYGNYDFLAALPKTDRLEIRFGAPIVIESKRLKQAVPVSNTSYKNCFDLYSKEEVDGELLGWISDAYHLKDTDS